MIPFKYIEKINSCSDNTPLALPLSADSIGFERFKGEIWNFYKQHGRQLPWRHEQDPYKIFVSEVMLQQTQVARVITKYQTFITTFPNITALATAPLDNLLAAWQGLGYNRRALFLQRAAQEIVNTYNAQIPTEPSILQTLPAIGPNSAGSIAAFAYNKPTTFIETNIRSVFIHFFASPDQKIEDKALLPLIKATLDQENPRDWYYALMDYGVFLKKNFENPSRRSAQHKKQSKFEGSDRQIRGMILRLLAQQKQTSKENLLEQLNRPAKQAEKAITALIKEGFLGESKDNIFLKK